MALRELSWSLPCSTTGKRPRFPTRDWFSPHSAIMVGMRWPIPLLVLMLLLAACSSAATSADPAAVGAPAGPQASTAPGAGAGSPSPPQAESTSPAPPASVPSTTRAVPSPTPVPPPTYSGTVEPVDPARLTHSWRPGCPVPVEDLRLVTVVHWTDDGGTATGELVVHADHAEAMVQVFEEVFDAGFPIHQMRLVDDFEGDDGRSMVADNTSAFNCREVAGRPGVWSEHASGAAVDINPLRNPWVRDGVVDPPDGARWADRSLNDPGMIHADGPVVRAFERVGWTWGGTWSSAKDYQHFSASGR